MKKNLISVIILALLIVNIALTAVMMFSVTNTNKMTADMVMKVAGAMDMEVSGTDGSAPTQRVSMEDTVTYNIADTMTILLKQGEDGEEHYIMLAVSLSMNSKHDDYKTYGESIAEKEPLIKEEIINVVGQYTLEEARADQEALKADILEGLQEMFNSDFIYKVGFSDVKFSG